MQTDYPNCLIETALKANLVIVYIVLSTDNSSDFVFFCLRTSPIESRSPVDVTSFAKFLPVFGPVVGEDLAIEAFQLSQNSPN